MTGPGAGCRGRENRVSQQTTAPGVRLTERLRLVPVTAAHAGDLWWLHRDEAVAAWYGVRWTAQMALRAAAAMQRAWETDGVHKWMAYDRRTGALIGRGGLSRAYVDGAWRLELGWALRSDRWGRGYATEIGRAGLAFAFDALGAGEVVAFTEPHNTRSRAVMQRLGMRHDRDIVHEGERFVLYRTARGPDRRAGGAAAYP